MDGAPRPEMVEIRGRRGKVLQGDIRTNCVIASGAETIPVAEDHSPVRKSALALLESPGYRAHRRGCPRNRRGAGIPSGPAPTGGRRPKWTEKSRPAAFGRSIPGSGCCSSPATPSASSPNGASSGPVSTFFGSPFSGNASRESLGRGWAAQTGGEGDRSGRKRASGGSARCGRRALPPAFRRVSGRRRNAEPFRPDIPPGRVSTPASRGSRRTGGR